MHRRWILLLALCCLSSLVVFATLIVSPTSAAGAGLRVNEAATRVRLREGQTEVLLVVENQAGQKLNARVSLEWLDPRDQVQARAFRRETIRPGTSRIVVPLPLPTEAKQNSERLWYRLRYRIMADSDASSPVNMSSSAAASSANVFAPVAGIISLSEIAPDIFELRVIASEFPFAGKRYRAHVRVAHPITGHSVHGVSITAELSFGNDETKLFRASDTTNKGGAATLDFDLPSDLRAREGRLKITAVCGDFRQELQEELNNIYQRLANILLSSDKTIYQPGQVLHVRSLALDYNRHAIANAAMELKIEDQEGTTQFRAPLKTSRFGVAGHDWTIPENARLGEYRVIVKSAEENYESGEAQIGVKISRYDLPNFAVKIKPDHSYYLPGQNAEVEVRADYLFGQPVTRGDIRVVRETEREWNYREQKWDIEEAEKYEGDIDAAGHFTARIDLTEHHKKLTDDDHSRFKDLNFAAYVTDATTGRTEQRRFVLRVTREAIHVYVIDADDKQAAGLPLQFYVSTSYADGTPASCEVGISEKTGEDKNDTPIEEALRKIRTNRYGVAKVSGLFLRLREERDDNVTLILKARDNKNLKGHREEEIRNLDRKAIRVETNKTLFRAGEPVEVSLIASESNPAVILSVTRDLKVLNSQFVRLRHGRAVVTLPYNGEFTDAITIIAQDTAPDCCSLNFGSHSVMYPHDQELKLNLRLDKEKYHPGEVARASLRVQTADGRAAESALGISIVDRAVEERARTDREVSGHGRSDDYFGSYLSAYDTLAGISLRDLNKLDLTQPLPDGLELVAEIMLRNSGYWPRIYSGDDYLKAQHRIFTHLLNAQFKPLVDALEAHYQKTGEYPRDQSSLRRILSAAGIGFDDLRDPWGQPYHANFQIERDSDVFSLRSSGADKKDSDDDFVALQQSWSYFKPEGEIISLALRQYHDRTGTVTRDPNDIKNELKQNGLDFAALRDRWGQAYEIELNVTSTRWSATIRSGGPNAKFDTRNQYTSDDFIVWTASVEYFETARKKIDAALAKHFKDTGSFPQSDVELRTVLSQQDFPLETLNDPWGNGYYSVFWHTVQYSDHVVVHYRDAQQKTVLKPVTQHLNFITLRSRGADRLEGTSDDFIVAEFSRLMAEQSITDQHPKAVTGGTILSGDGGAISGIITDASGAVVPHAFVTVTHQASLQIYRTASDNEGVFLIRNLPTGIYDLLCQSAGFKKSVIVGVTVIAANVAEVSISLQPGGMAETVTVTAAVEAVQTTSSSSATISEKRIESLSLNQRNFSQLVKLKPGALQIISKSETSTPRLRESFQETLVWQPSLETDRQGRAQLKFRLADNITAWKLKVIGSTVDGEIGIAEKEFLAFQPFFAEHDPPRVLTEGDEIALPVVLRNYLDKAQTVNAEIKSESWFTLLGPAHQRAEVKAGDAGRVIFDFRAAASIKDGKQRITAIGLNSDDAASDAIEKPVSVHPDGEEVTQTVSDIFTSSGALNLSLPADAIKGSARAELKIYPNLMAHALEGIEGILQRPYGCGEQTISSTYPNIMALRYFAGKEDKSSPIAAKAQRYAQAGYERLLGYRAASGGFSYWGRGEADLALTAYALRFLHEASEFVEVDDDVVDQARAWLIKQQLPDGRWPAHHYWQSAEDTRRSAMNTAFIARVLAMTSATTKPEKAVAEALKRALDYLAGRIEEIDEPYLIASYALAAMDADEQTGAAKAIGKLRSLAHEEAGTSYWTLESNTPFYGWGLAGRIETTALAVKALHRAAATRRHGDTVMEQKSDGATRRQGDGADNPQSLIRNLQSEDLVNRGLLFLLRNKDRYGVWLSTQATINVLDTFIALNDEQAKPDAGGQADVFVNDQRVTSVTMPPGNQLSSPLTVDLSSHLNTGSNRVEIRRSGNAARATAQLVESHYAPWKPSAAGQTENFRPGNSSALKLAVSYDKPSAKSGEEITCKVAAERVGSGGYGMLLAEIGLPPGADVDRGSLEKAMKESGWELNSYAVLPDRVIVYLWPRAGGTKFFFTFRPRYGIRAQTASSVLYDYYNPEARVVIAPTRFVVR